MPAQPLTPEQKADADRLQSFYGEWKIREKKAGRKANQDAIAALLGIGQSAFSQYCRGDIPLNVNILVKLREVTGADIESISPSLASEVSRLAAAANEGFEIDDHVPIHMVDAKASAGEGRIVFSDDSKKLLMFRRDYLAKNDAKQDDVIALEVDGWSMIDMHIPHGSVVLANRKKREPISKRVYVVWIEDELYVKQLIKHDGMWYARSHNKERASEFPDIPITNPDDRIEGRAFWCGFGL